MADSRSSSSSSSSESSDGGGRGGSNTAGEKVKPADVSTARRKRYKKLSERLKALESKHSFKPKEAPKEKAVKKAEEKRSKIPMELLARSQAAKAAAAAEEERKKKEAELKAEREQRIAREEAEHQQLLAASEERRQQKILAEEAAQKVTQPVEDPQTKVQTEPVDPEEEEGAFEESFPPGVKNRDIWGTWRRPMDFTLTFVGYVVGVHDFWRFPYLCYRFGGSKLNFTVCGMGSMGIFR